MFIRTKTTPNSPRKSVQIVENTRDAQGKVKQKIVRYVGISHSDSEELKLRALAMEIIAKMKLEEEVNSPQISMIPNLSDSEIQNGLESKSKAGRKAKKNIEDILPVSQVTLDMVEEESRIIDGVHEACGHIYDEIGYSNILSNKKYNNILKDLVLCRISSPTSKLATSKSLIRYYMKEHDLDSIYRTMDHVFKKIGVIQSATFMATQGLMGGEVEIILFDVTTLHFESVEADNLRKFGYSKNFRFNTTQIVLALATNSDGLPIGYELFEGNKAEVQTLIDTIDCWKEKFRIGKVCFIGDRAMFSADNLKQLELRGYQYIVAAKLRTLPDFMCDKILDENNYKPININNELTWTKEISYDPAYFDALKKLKKYQELVKENEGRRILVTYNSKRARHDAKHRESLLEKITKKLDKTTNSAKLISNSSLKKYTSNTGKSSSYIDQSKIDIDAKWDGFHGVITNISESESSNSHIISSYRKLVKIEDCFRVNKTTLKMRPIYHFKEERIRAHIAICYMAFSVIRQLEYRVKLLKKLSIASIIEELNSVQSSIFVHKLTKDKYRVPGNFSNQARSIYAAIGIKRNLDAHPII